MLFDVSKDDMEIFSNNNPYYTLIINFTLMSSFILCIYYLLFNLNYALLYAIINLFLVKLSDSYIMYKNAKDYLDNKPEE